MGCARDPGPCRKMHAPWFFLILSFDVLQYTLNVHGIVPDGDLVEIAKFRKDNGAQVLIEDPLVIIQESRYPVKRG